MIPSGATMAADYAVTPRGASGTARHSAGRLAGRLPLAAILAIQCALSMRLIWTNTAFEDEGLYLWAGHLEWAQWLHGTPITVGFPSYFSGAPAVYPPIGALADSIGGLAGARLLSTCFMLGTTWLLWSATRRLFGDRAAIFAAAAFAGTAATQFLGALATYDAMALMLLAAATWCAIRSGDCRRRSQVLLVAGTAALLVLANATKYASALWDPVVLALAALTDARYRGWRSGLVTGVAATAVVAGALECAAALAGPEYRAGIKFSTLDRSQGGTSSLAVLQDAGYWIGVLAVLAVVGAVILTRTRPSRALTWTGWTLAAAVLLAPVEQARIHSSVSLFKHVGYGGWFAAIMVGYAIATLTQPAGAAIRRRVAVISAAVLLALGVAGSVQATDHYASWPNSAALIARLRPLQAGSPGRWLVEDPFVPSYYIRRPAASWSNTWFFDYTDPATGVLRTGRPAYADAIRNHYFAIVVIGFTSTIGADRAIVHDLWLNRGYREIATVPWSDSGARGRYLIWRYEPVPGPSPAR